MHAAALRRRAAGGGCPRALKGALLKAADLHAGGARVVHHRRLGDLLHVVHVERARARAGTAIFGTVGPALGARALGQAAAVRARVRADATCGLNLRKKKKRIAWSHASNLRFLFGLDPGAV